jgi:nuclease HARBI1
MKNLVNAILIDMLSDEDSDDEDLWFALSLRPKLQTGVSNFNLNAFSAVESRSFFRFSTREIAQLVVGFGLPTYMKTKENIHFQSTEGLCLLLRKMATPQRYVDLTTMFHRSHGAMSHIFYCMLEFIYNKYKDTLYMNVQLIRSRIANYADAIEKKGCPLPNVWAFIDGTVRGVCRPTFGQQAIYSGHKRKHGLKFQTLAAPDGLIVHIWGAIEARRHDITLLRLSKLESTLKSDEVFKGYLVYGDPAYGCSDQFVCPYPTVLFTPEKKKFNKIMSKLRVAVEWSYGDVVRYWSYLDMKSRMKSQQIPVTQLYVVAVLLTNCLTITRGGNTTSDYFSLAPPTLQEYLASNLDTD